MRSAASDPTQRFERCGYRNPWHERMRSRVDGTGPAEGRVALVSGGNRGLGLDVVRKLAERRMRVVLASRSRDGGRAAVELLDDLADRVAVRQVDITDPGSVGQLVSWLDRRLGRCDVLVNNAGVLFDGEGGSVGVDLDVVRRTLETNLLGTWRITQAVVPLMRAGSYGRIVNVSSCSLRHAPRLPAFQVSKGAVNLLTRMLADELAHTDILVNACCPESCCAGIDGTDRPESGTAADTALWLATLPAGGPTGGFYSAHTVTPEW